MSLNMFETNDTPQIITVADETERVMRQSYHLGEYTAGKPTKRLCWGDLLNVAGTTDYYEYPTGRKLPIVNNLLCLPLWYTRQFAKRRIGRAWFDTIKLPVQVELKATDVSAETFFKVGKYEEIHKIICIPRSLVDRASPEQFMVQFIEDGEVLNTYPESFEMVTEYTRCLRLRRLVRGILVELPETVKLPVRQVWQGQEKALAWPETPVHGWRLGNWVGRKATYEGYHDSLQSVLEWTKQAFRHNPKVTVSKIDRSFALNYDGNVTEATPYGTIFKWPHLIEWLVQIVPTLMDLDVPPYVILEIIDWLPHFGWVRHIDKIRKIEAVIRSVRKVRAARLTRSTTAKSQ